MLKTRRILAVALILVLALSLGGVFAQELNVDKDKTYVFGIDMDYPPWTSYKKGKAYGFEVEAYKRIAEHFDLKYKMRGLPWKTAVPALAAGKIDVLFSGMYITSERDKKIDFTKPYRNEYGFLLVKEDSDITVAELLAGNYKIGGLAGGTQLFYLKNWAKKPNVDIKPVGYESDALALQDLDAGRITAMLADVLPACEYLDKYDVKRLVKLYGYANQVAAGVKEGDPDNLIPLLNKGVKWLWKTGQWRELWAKYMPEKSVPEGPLPLERRSTS